MAAPGVIKCFGPKVTLKKRKRYFAVLRVVAYERSVDVRCLCSNVESTDGETTMRTNHGAGQTLERVQLTYRKPERK